jgi:hypothetical protein
MKIEVEEIKIAVAGQGRAHMRGRSLQLRDPRPSFRTVLIPRRMPEGGSCSGFFHQDQVYLARQLVWGLNF